MFPVFWTLSMSPETARLAGFAFALLGAAIIVWEGLRARARRTGAVLLQGVGFLAVAGALAHVFLRPEQLPAVVRIDLRSWGLFVVMGMGLCYLVQRRLGRRIGLDGDRILSLWVYGGLAGMAGARLVHVIVNWDVFSQAPASALALWDGGMVYLGGVLGWVLFTFAYLKHQRLAFEGLDVLVVGIALTHGFGRIGCFLAGCCYGRETDLPVGVSFPPGSIAQHTIASMGRIAGDAPTGPLHPTQIYEAAICFVIGAVILTVYRRAARRTGEALCLYFILYPIARFFLEMLRDDPERRFLFRLPEDAPLALSTAQAMALLVVPLAAFGLYRVRSEAGALASAREVST